MYSCTHTVYVNPNFHMCCIAHKTTNEYKNNAEFVESGVGSISAPHKDFSWTSYSPQKPPTDTQRAEELNQLMVEPIR